MSSPVGTYSDNGRCQQCPPNSYNTVSGSTLCFTCDAGSQVGVVGVIQCVLCPVNTFSNDQSFCEPWPPDSYVAGSFECQTCGVGMRVKGTVQQP